MPGRSPACFMPQSMPQFERVLGMPSETPGALGEARSPVRSRDVAWTLGSCHLHCAINKLNVSNRTVSLAEALILTTDRKMIDWELQACSGGPHCKNENGFAEFKGKFYLMHLTSANMPRRRLLTTSYTSFVRARLAATMLQITRLYSSQLLQMSMFSTSR